MFVLIYCAKLCGGRILRGFVRKENIQYKNAIPLTTKLSLKLNCMIKTHKSRFVCTLSGFEIGRAHV